MEVICLKDSIILPGLSFAEEEKRGGRSTFLGGEQG